MTGHNTDRQPLPYGPAEAALFDEEIVREVVQFIGDDTYRRLLGEFTQGLPQKLDTLEVLVGNPDFPDDAAMRVAHQLKGAAQALGLPRLAHSMSTLASFRDISPNPDAVSLALAELRETMGLLLRLPPQPEPRGVP